MHSIYFVYTQVILTEQNSCSKTKQNTAVQNIQFRALRAQNCLYGFNNHHLNQLFQGIKTGLYICPQRAWCNSWQFS